MVGRVQGVKLFPGDQQRLLDDIFQRIGSHAAQPCELQKARACARKELFSLKTRLRYHSGSSVDGPSWPCHFSTCISLSPEPAQTLQKRSQRTMQRKKHAQGRSRSSKPAPRWGYHARQIGRSGLPKKALSGVRGCHTRYAAGVTYRAVGVADFPPRNARLIARTASTITSAVCSLMSSSRWFNS